MAAEFMAAVRYGDGDRLRGVYHENARIWHTFDGLEQDREQNIRTLRWMSRHVSGLRYVDIRVTATEDGFVQQHVMRADDPVFTAPCMLRAWCADGRILRIEEYVDSAHTRPLTDHIAAVRAARPPGAAGGSADTGGDEPDQSAPGRDGVEGLAGQ